MPTVLALSVLVSLLMMAGTVRLWPRLAKRGWAAVLGRIATILGTQLAVVCTLALVANNYGSFYSSWAELLGAGQDGSVTIQDKLAGDGKPLGVQTLGKDYVHGWAVMGDSTGGYRALKFAIKHPDDRPLTRSSRRDPHERRHTL
ncbi:hypothetical protein [Kitasatospora sp. GP82]|uniref:hypothetical protein n=1 Tax=Kitasatospora sp. GP82 TaxID=3035089 RepID=UPI0024749857|nr:hypothetical protein [Kitasatospora sp. GP82]MDH6128110.1 S-formylglutathione hydrolase FrmB [Kitasatospora sp. GP82]